MKAIFGAKTIPFFCLILFAVIFGGQMLAYRQAEEIVSVGIVRYQCGDYGTAESKMRSALDLNPNNAYASYYLGLCLQHDGDTVEARRCLETAQTIALGDKFVAKNEPLYEDASTALDRCKHP